MPRILERVGLGRPELRAWALYDWANSAWVLTIQTAVFPVYFLEVAASDLPEAVALQRYTWTTSIALAAIALTAPILGAVADFLAARKRMLGTFLAVGVVATACMVLIDRGEWLLAAVLFGAANIGAQGAVRAGAEPTIRDPAAALRRSRSALEAALQSRRRRQ